MEDHAHENDISMIKFPPRTICTLFAPLMVALLMACGKGEEPPPGDAIRITIDPVESLVAVTNELTTHFTEETGIPVEIHLGPRSISERLNLYQQMVGSRASGMDLYLIDVIWIGHFPGQFVDLRDHFSRHVSDFFPAIIENNTLHGELIALPWFTDVGVMYYRRDLLEKYDIAPPETWDDFEAAALTIQEGERAAGNPDFWGFAWQGGPREALTCNLMEWFATHGVGSLFNEDGDFTLDRRRATAALDRAAGWIGHITNPDVLQWIELESVEAFHAGNAAFLRYWSFGWGSLNAPELELAGKIGVMTMPTANGTPSGTLGGWQFALSRSSENQEDALKLLRFLTSENSQRKMARAGFLPTRPKLYEDGSMAEHFEPLKTMLLALDEATLRPSAEYGRNYNAFSTLMQRLVSNRLSGAETSEKTINDITTRASLLLRE
ncbi:MAG: ABC transporter substrate-binding protein [Candidatus Sumerlaeia bacterium]|nr:ABC transporter substrate-binding protein [Candidatus Sumerlaeia bacterium]